ncbi:ABC transporter substrate-binding protein [Paenibacillus oceani]|uniref:ABC transporter substrate-binding protein n=1 Tax=Paenibacillus oceani TaxID=2772510 RepID=A0A927H0P3_9BACL|nr:ABC transporter substrate-binding protein [Paenibacillus oceani]MBD2862684.1 ABC transporter substrate-binding protein [Paenibacillus oceani]
MRVLRTCMPLIGIALLTAILSGCSDRPPAPVSNAPAAPTAVVVKPGGEYPIADQHVTLKVMVKQNPLVEDFATNAFTKWYEHKTNVHIDWEVVPARTASETLSHTLLSGELPDIILDMNISENQQMIYGSQGIFVPLGDYIERYGYETKKLFAEFPAIKEWISTPDGTIYALPKVNQCYHCSMPQKMWIYKPWLDKLGLDVPTTTEELYLVLKAFKEEDPNGNGLADEIPLSGYAGLPLDMFIMNAFLLNNDRFYVKDGQIDVSFNKPEWKEGLLFLHRLYNEKLLAPQSFTQDREQYMRMGEHPGTPILGAGVSMHMGMFTQLYGPSGRWKDYVAVPPLLGPGGVRFAASDPFGLRAGNFLITKSNPYPEISFRWADGLYRQEHSLRALYGQEGIDWEYAKPGDIGIDGKPALWRRLLTYGQVGNVHWEQTGLFLRPERMFLGEKTDPKQPLEPILYNETKKYEPYAPEIGQVPPPLYFQTDQVGEVAELKKTINEYVDRMLARFVTGDVRIEIDWDSYLKTLDSLNLNRYLQIIQKAYDEKYAK